MRVQKLTLFLPCDADAMLYSAVFAVRDSLDCKLLREHKYYYYILLHPVSVRPSVRLSVTSVHCIQTAEDIVKHLSWPGSPMVLVFLTQAPILNSKGNPFG